MFRKKYSELRISKEKMNEFLSEKIVRLEANVANGQSINEAIQYDLSTFHVKEDFMTMELKRIKSM